MSDQQRESPARQAASCGTSDRIVRAGMVVGIAHLCFKFLGLIQAAIAGKYIETGTFEAVYVFAYEAVLVTVFLVGEEVIGPSFLPVFMAERDKHGEEDAWRFANVVLTVQALILVVVIGVIMLFPDTVIGLLTSWNQTDEPDKVELARTSVVWLAPSLLFLSLGSTTYMLLNGYKRFFLAAFGDASWKIIVIISLVAGMGMFGFDYRALVFGLLVGSVAKLGTHLVGLLRQLVRVRPSLAWRQPAIRSMVILMLPLIAGILFAKVRDIYNNVTVLSYLEEGLMQANSFGRKLYIGISWLAPYAVSIAMFPFFCELVDRNDRKKLGEVMTGASRMLLAVFVPGALLIAVLAQPIAVVLFQRGEVNLEAARLAGLSTACYTLVLPAFALEYILMQGYFANRKMLSVTLIGMAASALSVAISHVFIVRLGMRAEAALMAVALGYTVSRTVKTSTLIVVLKRTVPMLRCGETLVFLARVMVVGLAVGSAGWATMRGLGSLGPATPGKIILLGQLFISGLVGGIVFFALSWLLRVREPFDMAKWGWQKARQKLGR